MYPNLPSNSSSSSHHGDGSRLTATANSDVNGQDHHLIDFSSLSGGGHLFPNPSPSSARTTRERLQGTSGLHLNEFATGFSPTSTHSPSLLRHSSSPAGFPNGIFVSSPNDGRVSRLNSQHTFRGTNSLSQISEEASIMFSSSSSHNNQTKLVSFDVKRLHILDSEFGMLETDMEADAMEKLKDIPHDFVPCKPRAKRGCATHPRSIAERERRTRISGKLKKLQDLVPNMDKQTCYADMLDLAVQHIKGLQAHVQDLNNDLKNCTCGCKRT